MSGTKSFRDVHFEIKRNRRIEGINLHHRKGMDFSNIFRFARTNENTSDGLRLTSMSDKPVSF